jgi:hypothetical protein
LSEPKSYDDLRALGFTWPTEWAAPVLRVLLTEPSITAFCGTASLLGDDLFLTAGHVADAAGLVEGEYPCLAIFVTEEQQYQVGPVIALERHEAAGVDLAIGRFDRVAVPRTLSGWGMVGGWSDVKCVGYPDELVGPTEFSAYSFGARFLKGYVMRRLESGDHFQLTFPSLELSFPIPKGMSGAPILAETQAGHVLCGIATSSVEVRVAHHHTIAETEEGNPYREERVERIVEVGIALRVSEFMTWSPPLLEGRTLGDLLPIRAA